MRRRDNPLHASMQKIETLRDDVAQLGWTHLSLWDLACIMEEEDQVESFSPYQIVLSNSHGYWYFHRNSLPMTENDPLFLASQNHPAPLKLLERTHL